MVEYLAAIGVGYVMHKMTTNTEAEKASSDYKQSQSSKILENKLQILEDRVGMEITENLKTETTGVTEAHVDEMLRKTASFSDIAARSKTAENGYGIANTAGQRRMWKEAYRTRQTQMGGKAPEDSN